MPSFLSLVKIAILFSRKNYGFVVRHQVARATSKVAQACRAQLIQLRLTSARNYFVARDTCATSVIIITIFFALLPPKCEEFFVVFEKI